LFLDFFIVIVAFCAETDSVIRNKTGINTNLFIFKYNICFSDILKQLSGLSRNSIFCYLNNILPKSVKQTSEEYVLFQRKY